MAGGKITRPLMATVWLPDLNYGIGMLPLCTMLVPCHYCHPLNTLPLLWRGAVVQQQQLLGRHPHTIFQWLQTFWLVQIVTRDQGRPCDWSQMLTRSPLIWLSGWNLTRVDPGSSDGWQCDTSVSGLPCHDDRPHITHTGHWYRYRYNTMVLFVVIKMS